MTAVDELPCGWLRVDEQRVIVQANTEAARLLECGLSELTGQRLSTFLPIASRIFFQVHLFAELIERGQLDEVYVSLQTKAGRELPVLLSARRAVASGDPSLVWVFQPMRRRHLVERELIHSQAVADRATAAEQAALTKVRDAQARLALQERLAAMGTLAAGVAHEINNPLTFVLGNLHMLRERLEGQQGHAGEAKPDLAPLFADTHEGLERIRTIVTSLRGLSRFDHHRIAPVDIGQVLANAHRLCAHELKSRVTVTMDIPSPAPVVSGDEGRLVQVFVNLLVNAVQAMPERPVAENRIVIRAHALENDGARIEVEDKGCGMPADVQARVFDPFFTTKPVGVGTGLGLSVSHGIISSLGGTLEVVSLEGEGTAMRVWLPLANPATAGHPATTATNAASTPPATHVATSGPHTVPDEASPTSARARVLIVDDEEFVAKAVGRMLAGYDVTVVHSGELAVQRFAAGERFDLVLCDLMMPGMSGREVYEAVAGQAPDQARRFIFMSGGTFDREASQFLHQIPNEHVEKPFHPSDIREACARGLAAVGGAQR